MVICCWYVLQISTWGYKAIAISVATGQGLPELSAALAGKLSAVIGPSGVGKSSIINALRLQQQQQQQQEQHHSTALSDAATAPTSQAAAGVTEAPAPALMSIHEAAVGSHAQGNQTEEASASHHAQSTADSSPGGVHNTSPLQQKGHGLTRASAESSAASDAIPVQTDRHEHGHKSHQQQQQQQLEVPDVPDQQMTSLQRSTESRDGGGSSVHDSPWANPGLPVAGTDQAAASTAQTAPELGSAGSATGQSEGAVQLQSVGEMSNIGRGMHTTRHVALLEVRHWPFVCLLAGAFTS